MCLAHIPTVSGFNVCMRPVNLRLMSSGRMVWYSHGRPTYVVRVDTTTAVPTMRRLARIEARVLGGMELVGVKLLRTHTSRIRWC